MLLASVLLLAGGAYGMYHLKKDSADGRLLMWKVSTQIIREQRGLGVGVGHFPEAFRRSPGQLPETCLQPGKMGGRMPGICL